MKKIIYISVLLILAVISCKKNNMETFDSDQIHTITDTLLKSKFIDPVQQAECFKLLLKSKNRDDTAVFFLIKDKGKYVMGASNAQYAQPYEVKLSFGTNATTATLSFSEDAPFVGIFNDLGGDVTRSMDISYSFVKSTARGFELEGNSYGDKLEMIYTDINSSVVQNIKSGLLYKTLKAQIDLFQKTPYNVLLVNGKPLQVMVDPSNNEIWTFFSENAAAQITFSSGARNSYKPTLSAFSTFTYSSTGDTLQLALPIEIKGMTINQLIWDSDKNIYQALAQSAGQHQLQPFAASNVPAYSFAELSSYILSLEDDTKSSSVNFKNFLKRTKIPLNYSIDFAQIANNPDYMQGWSSGMKERALKVAAKLKGQLGNNKYVRLETTTSSAFSGFFAGVGVDQDLIYYENNVPTSTISLQLLEIYTLGFPIGDNKSFMGLEYLWSSKWSNTDLPVTDEEAIALLWPELYDFVKIYDSAKLKMTYLPPRQGEKNIRVQVQNASTGDTFIADGL